MKKIYLRNCFLRFMRNNAIAMILLLGFNITFHTNSGFAGELTGIVASESRIFPRSPLLSGQDGTGFSVMLQPEYYHTWGDHSILLVPFFRYDQHDDERTHFDIRELYWQMAGSSWELSIGLRKIFWGVTESVHLVDVINQTDFVENVDGEQKLGQPMLNLVWIRDWGTLSFFVLPGFRQRTFPAANGRFRFPLPVDTEQSQYESDAEEWHIDWAARYVHTLGDIDFGLAHFLGTSREPRFSAGTGSNGLDVLVPIYDLIHQTSLDLQVTRGGWLWKLEVISRTAHGNRMNAAAGGFEYTFANLRNSGIDLGLIGEYLYDDRDPTDFAPTAFQDDIFVGARLALNDVQSTEFLLGAIVDREKGSSFFNLEASRRIGDTFKLNIEIRAFANVDTSDFLYAFRQDSYLKLELAYYF